MASRDYCIRVQAHLGAEWSDWFEGLVVHCQPDGTTTLSGPVRDQAALQGILLKVRDLGAAMCHPLIQSTFSQEEKTVADP